MIAFAVAALLLIMVPGPDQALVTRSALVGGRRAGVFTMLGGLLGVTVHACAAAIGLSALLLTSATAFSVVKLVVAAYLLWLGMQMLRSGTRARIANTHVERSAPTLLRSSYLRQGFLSNALNPKVALFFLTVLPQFFSADSGSAHVQALTLSAVFAALYVAWFGLYLASVERFGRWLRRSRVKDRIEQLTGTFLVVVAARLAMTSH